MQTELKIIVLTGPESSGKSYLSQQLAKEFDLPLVSEYARIYIDELDRAYVEEDLGKILAGHQAQLKSLITRGSSDSKWVVLDTDFLTIKIWSQEKYGRYPKIVDQVAELFPAVHYLLCKPDIPWEFDPQRENPEDRDRLFEIYWSELESSEYPFTIIQGDFHKRSNQARSVISSLLR